MNFRLINVKMHNKTMGYVMSINTTSRYTNTLSTYELMEMFPTDESARHYFEAVLWNGIPQCSHCSFQEQDGAYSHPTRIGLYRCHQCQGQFTVQTNTVMHASKIPLRKWLYGLYLIVTARKGISSYQLAKELGITQKSAWFMGHRIRAACREGDQLLKGVIEMDETYLGGKEKNKHKYQRIQGTQVRSTKTKTAVVGMRTRDGIVRAASMKSVNSQSIQQRLDEQVAQGSTLCTDEATIYKPIKGYHQLTVNHSVGEFVKGMANTNGIESVWALLKRGYHGTFHHFTSKHIDRYVNEFCFRLNGGNVKWPTLSRIDSIISGFSNNRLAYKTLIAGINVY
jgi:transposase-like protein